MKIFISIASYKDKLLTNTVTQAYENAKYKDNLVFGIFEQNYQDQSLPLLEYSNQIRYSRIEPEDARGVCYARQKIQSMFQNEDFYLQIDAHTLFERDWDETFINTLEKIEQYQTNPIITAYPNNFNSETFKKSVYNNNSIAILHCLSERDHTFEYYGYPGPVGGWHITDHHAIHGFYLGGCCIFTRGTFVIDCPYHDGIFFGGEEYDLTVRAWTRNYNFFHIKNLPIYHCWEKEYGASIVRDRPTLSGLNLDTKKRIEDLINGTIKGVEGLGQQRTIDQYTRFSGLDFLAKSYRKNPILFETSYQTKL